jgi:hypothetical protein
MQVRRISVARVPYKPEDLADSDAIASFDANRPRLQVGVKRVETVAQVENNSVPSHRVQRHPGRSPIGRDIVSYTVLDRLDAGVGNGNRLGAIAAPIAVLSRISVGRAILSGSDVR